MEHNPNTDGPKPYKIRERLELFAIGVVQIALKLQHGPEVARALSAHAAESASSAASNAEEADDGSSRRDFIAKERICLRELKETKVRLRILRGAGVIGAAEDALISENQELIRIVAAIIRNSGG